MSKEHKSDADGYKHTYWRGVGDVMLEEHLSNLPRLHRRNLIITSSLGIITSLTGLVPRNIMGVDLTGASQSILLWCLILVIIYQWISFGIYSWPDRLQYQSKLIGLGFKPEALGDLPIAAFPAGLRKILDYYFPSVLAIISVILLLWYAIPVAGNPKENDWLGFVARITLTSTCILISLIAGAHGIVNIYNTAKGKYSLIDPNEERKGLELPPSDQ